MSVQQFRSLLWVDYVLYAIVDPRALARLILKSKNGFLPGSLVIPVVVSLFEIVALSLLSKQSSLFMYKVSYGWIALSIIVVVILFALASMIDLFVQFSGKTGKIPATVTLIAFAQFPHLLLLPLVAIVVAPHTVVTAPHAIYFVAWIALTIWCTINLISGVSEIYEITFPKACASVLVPLGIAVFLAMLLLVVSGVVFAGMMQSIFSGLIR